MLKAHSLITLAFSFLLEVVHVYAYDVANVLESFVKHVPSPGLPSSIGL